MAEFDKRPIGMDRLHPIGAAQGGWTDRGFPTIADIIYIGLSSFVPGANGKVMDLNGVYKVVDQSQRLRRQAEIKCVIRSLNLFLGLLVPILGLFPLAVSAADMRDCIQITTESNPIRPEPHKVMVNTCASSVYVFWCQVSGSKYPCTGEVHFQTGRYFSPGERYESRVTLPDDNQIDVGACSGSRLRIKFTGKGQYECPDKTMNVEGQSPNYGQVRCNDGRRVGFEWTLKGESEKVAVVMLKDGAVAIPRSAYLAFEKNPNGQPPAVLKTRVCEAPLPSKEQTFINGIRQTVHQKAEEIEEEARQRCAKIGNLGESCERFRNPPRRTSPAPQG